MLYVLSVLFPPLAILLCGRPFQAAFSIFATMLFWVPGVIWAFFVVNDRNNNLNTQKLVKATDRQTAALIKATKGR